MGHLRLRQALGLILGLIGASLRADPVGSRHLMLRPGDSEEVHFPPGTDLAISRRGIVDAFHLGDGRWQVTALHAGFVVIDAHDASTGEPRWPRLFIDVAHAPADGEHPAAAAELPTWLCRDPGIHCDHEARIITGQAPSLLWYSHARASCQSLAGCFFAVGLTPVLMTEWLGSLREALGSPYTVTASGSVPIIEAYCGKGGREQRRAEVDALTNRALTDGLLWLRCREESGLPRYRLHARMYLVEAATAEALGIGTEAAAKLTWPLIDSSATWLSRLEALAKDHRAEMIGEPVFRLAPNHQAELTSGGEFQVVEHVVRTDRPEQIPERADWKQHGLMLKAAASPLTPGRVRLSYDMTFKSRQQESDQALTVNSLKSEIDLTLGTPAMAGILDLSASGTDHLGLPLLSQVPVIGPLFRRRLTQAANSRLLLWFTISEDEAVGELPAPAP